MLSLLLKKVTLKECNACFSQLFCMKRENRSNGEVVLYGKMKGNWRKWGKVAKK